MSSIEGDLRVGEANRAVRAIAARQSGSPWIAWAVLAAFIGGGAVLSVVVLRTLPVELGAFGSYRASIGAVLGAAAYLFVARPIALARFRSNFARRGQPLDLPLRLEVAPDKLRYTVGAVAHIADWSAVTEVFYSAGYWIFLAQANCFFAPRRLFADEEAEQAFLREALSHMSPEARRRSVEAVRAAGLPEDAAA